MKQEERGEKMFQITVDDVLVIRDNVAISGKCSNINEFSSKLFDEDGAEYFGTIPFIKHVVPPQPDYITLELRNIQNPHLLIGRVLRSVPQ